MAPHFSLITSSTKNQSLLIPSELDTYSSYLGPNAKAPDLATIKDFFQFYASLSYETIETQHTTKLVNARMEFFFAGFTRLTGTAMKVSQDVVLTSASSG